MATTQTEYGTLEWRKQCCVCGNFFAHGTRDDLSRIPDVCAKCYTDVICKELIARRKAMGAK